LVLLGFAAASAQLADRKALTLEAAKKIAAAAEAEAKKNNWRVVIAIVDDGGHLIYLQRIDETQSGSVEIASKRHARRSASSARRRSLRTPWPGAAWRSSGFPASSPARADSPSPSKVR